MRDCCNPWLPAELTLPLAPIECAPGSPAAHPCTSLSPVSTRAVLCQLRPYASLLTMCQRSYTCSSATGHVGHKWTASKRLQQPCERAEHTDAGVGGHSWGLSSASPPCIIPALSNTRCWESPSPPELLGAICCAASTAIQEKEISALSQQQLSLRLPQHRRRPPTG
jgi:hypothetical protein